MPQDAQGPYQVRVSECATCGLRDTYKHRPTMMLRHEWRESCVKCKTNTDHRDKGAYVSGGRTGRTE